MQPIVLAVALGSVLASCVAPAGGLSSAVPSEPSATAPRASHPSTIATRWVLAAGTIGGQPLPLLAERPITLVLGEGELSGTSACNHYRAKVERSGENLHLTDIVSSVQDCGGGVMVTDEAFLATVPRITRIDESRPGVLVLAGRDLVLTFTPEPSR